MSRVKTVARATRTNRDMVAGGARAQAKGIATPRRSHKVAGEARAQAKGNATPCRSREAAPSGQPTDAMDNQAQSKASGVNDDKKKFEEDEEEAIGLSDEASEASTVDLGIGEDTAMQSVDQSYLEDWTAAEMDLACGVASGTIQPSQVKATVSQPVKKPALA